MRALVQRVKSAEVRVDGQSIGQIGPGLLAYCGVFARDESRDADRLAEKILHLRVFPDSAGKMNLDVLQAGGGAVLVSNFTLCADTGQGRRPAFVAAARPEIAQPLIEKLAARLREGGLAVETGRFGAAMEVAACNDGPINIILESR